MAKNVRRVSKNGGKGLTIFTNHFNPCTSKHFPIICHFTDSHKKIGLLNFRDCTRTWKSSIFGQFWVIVICDKAASISHSVSDWLNIARSEIRYLIGGFWSTLNQMYCQWIIHIFKIFLLPFPLNYKFSLKFHQISSNFDTVRQISQNFTNFA